MYSTQKSIQDTIRKAAAGLCFKPFNVLALLVSVLIRFNGVKHKETLRYDCSCDLLWPATTTKDTATAPGMGYGHPEVHRPLRLTLTATLKLIIYTLARTHAQTH